MENAAFPRVDFDGFLALIDHHIKRFTKGAASFETIERDEESYPLAYAYDDQVLPRDLALDIVFADPKNRHLPFAQPCSLSSAERRGYAKMIIENFPQDAGLISGRA
jgi:hypothetical protein